MDAAGNRRQKGQGPKGGIEFGPQGLIGRVQVRLATLAAEDLAALDLRRAGIIRTGRTILAELVAAVVNADIGAEPGGDLVHCQLAASWGLDEAGADLIRRVLVLLADHELNASELLTRLDRRLLAGATPYAVVSAALGALSGRRHGGQSPRAEALFDEIGDRADPMPVMAARLARGDDLPGLAIPCIPTAIRAPARSSRRSPGHGRLPAPASRPPHPLRGSSPDIIRTSISRSEPR